jgi:hypothetical protein
VTPLAAVNQQHDHTRHQVLAIEHSNQEVSRQQNRFSLRLTTASVFAGAVISELANLIIPLPHH